MRRNCLRPIALAAVLLHAVAISIGLGHRHDDADRSAAKKASPCCHQHSHREPVHSQHRAPHDHEDCAACRHLAQPVWHAVVELEFSAGQLFATLPDQGMAPAISTPRICYLSRGPPGSLA